MQAVTRHNSDTWLAKGFGFLKEWLAGYGVRPFRVLGMMFGALLISASAFSLALGNADGIMLAAGALFTFGAKPICLTTSASCIECFMSSPPSLVSRRPQCSSRFWPTSGSGNTEPITGCQTRSSEPSRAVPGLVNWEPLKCSRKAAPISCRRLSGRFRPRAFPGTAASRDRGEVPSRLDRARSGQGAGSFALR